MFEIRDLDVPDHLYGTASTLADAEHLVDRRVTETRCQLKANGEGASHLWVRSAIYRDDGTLMISGAVGLCLEYSRRLI